MELNKTLEQLSFAEEKDWEFTCDSENLRDVIEQCKSVKFPHRAQCLFLLRRLEDDTDLTNFHNGLLIDGQPVLFVTNTQVQEAYRDMVSLIEVDSQTIDRAIEQERQRLDDKLTQMEQKHKELEKSEDVPEEDETCTIV